MDALDGDELGAEFISTDEVGDDSEEAEHKQPDAEAEPIEADDTDNEDVQAMDTAALNAWLRQQVEGFTEARAKVFEDQEINGRRFLEVTEDRLERWGITGGVVLDLIKIIDSLKPGTQDMDVKVPEDYEEFLEMMIKKNGQRPEHGCHHDGQVPQEFVAAFRLYSNKKRGEILCAQVGKALFALGVDSASETKAGPLSTLLTTHDKNQDGWLTFEEFCAVADAFHDHDHGSHVGSEGEAGGVQLSGEEVEMEHQSRDSCSEEALEVASCHSQSDAPRSVCSEEGGRQGDVPVCSGCRERDAKIEDLRRQLGLIEQTGSVDHLKDSAHRSRLDAELTAMEFTARQTEDSLRRHALQLRDRVVLLEKQNARLRSATTAKSSESRLPRTRSASHNGDDGDMTAEQLSSFIRLCAASPPTPSIHPSDQDGVRGRPDTRFAASSDHGQLVAQMLTQELAKAMEQQRAAESRAARAEAVLLSQRPHILDDLSYALDSALELDHRVDPWTRQRNTLQSEGLADPTPSYHASSPRTHHISNPPSRPLSSTLAMDDNDGLQVRRVVEAATVLASPPPSTAPSASHEPDDEGHSALSNARAVVELVRSVTSQAGSTTISWAASSRAGGSASSPTAMREWTGPPP